MKNVLKYIGIGLFLAIMAVINFKSCVGELFVSNEELADMEYERRNDKQKYRDGVYQCELEWLNWFSNSNRTPMHRWNAKAYIEYDQIQYVAISYGDTIWTSDISELKITDSKTYNFTTSDGMDFRLSLQ